MKNEGVNFIYKLCVEVWGVFIGHAIYQRRLHTALEYFIECTLQLLIYQKGLKAFEASLFRKIKLLMKSIVEWHEN